MRRPAKRRLAAVASSVPLSGTLTSTGERKTLRAALLPVIATSAIALALVSSPSVAQAATTYYSGSLTQNVWAWSGHRTMSGSNAYGSAWFGQILKLQDDGYNLVSGLDHVWIDHASVYTISKCGWDSNGTVAAGTTASTVCNYE